MSACIVGGVASPAHAVSCPDSGWTNITNVKALNNFTGTGVNIRSGPSTTCTAVGQGQPSHDTIIHCYKAVGSYHWTHLKDTTTGISGWVRNDYLTFVSGNPC